MYFDLNQDHFIDAVITQTFSDTINILQGVGDGTFFYVSELNNGPRPKSIGGGDFNKDGLFDLVVPSSDDHLNLYLGAGKSKFMPPISIVQGGPTTSLLIVDIDQNNTLDICTAHLNLNEFRVSLGNGDATFQSPHIFDTSSPVRALISDDINLDNRLDLIAMTNNTSVFLGQEADLFNTEQIFHLAAPSQSPSLTDIDHDGDLDLVALTSERFSILHNQTISDSRECLADLTGDGTLK